MIKHDTGNTRYFTRSEAESHLGKPVKVSSGDTLVITGMFCEGENEYTLLSGSVLVYKSDKNCVYLV